MVMTEIDPLEQLIQNPAPPTESPLGTDSNPETGPTREEPIPKPIPISVINPPFGEQELVWQEMEIDRVNYDLSFRIEDGETILKDSPERKALWALIPAFTAIVKVKEEFAFMYPRVRKGGYYYAEVWMNSHKLPYGSYYLWEADEDLRGPLVANPEDIGWQSWKAYNSYFSFNYTFFERTKLKPFFEAMSLWYQGKGETRKKPDYKDYRNLSPYKPWYCPIQATSTPVPLHRLEFVQALIDANRKTK